MKNKSIQFLALLVALIMALGVLAACSNSDVSVPQDAASPAEPVADTLVTEPKSDSTEATDLPEVEASVEPASKSYTQEELYEVYNESFVRAVTAPDAGDRESCIFNGIAISAELLYTSLDLPIPFTHANDFRAWCDAAYPYEPNPFTVVFETVYATTNVNIRADYSAESEKVGTLHYGESIDRIGIGTGEADGWSEVISSTGAPVYIMSDYLSTIKPSTSVNTSSGKNQSQNQGQSQSKPANNSGQTNQNSTSQVQTGGNISDDTNGIEVDPNSGGTFGGITDISKTDGGNSGKLDTSDIDLIG